MKEIQEAFGEVIKTVGMLFECLLWGGTDLARRVLNGTYLRILLATTVLAIYFPLRTLIAGLNGGVVNAVAPFVIFFAIFATSALIGSIRAQDAKRRGGSIARLVIFGSLATALLVVYLAGVGDYRIAASGPAVVWSGIVFLAAGGIWYAVALPALLLISAGVELGAITKAALKKGPAPAPAPAKKK